MKLIDVQNICKKYSGFELNNVSISLEEGCIMGFIGRNGAGKTTTIKSMLNLVHPDSGTVRINGYDLTENELAVRQSTGYVSGGVDFYPHTKIKKLTSVTKRFYTEWDEQRYRELLDRFEIDENKKVKELSAGMKVKYSLAVALSHNARLLLLDE
ncbi:MAG: ABC transporter ATP-binding protein, partial [Treponema sp.]